jgi:hypothetical protein
MAGIDARNGLAALCEVGGLGLATRVATNRQWAALTSNPTRVSSARGRARKPFTITGSSPNMAGNSQFL